MSPLAAPSLQPAALDVQVLGDRSACPEPKTRRSIPRRCARGWGCCGIGYRNRRAAHIDRRRRQEDRCHKSSCNAERAERRVGEPLACVVGRGGHANAEALPLGALPCDLPSAGQMAMWPFMCSAPRGHCCVVVLQQPQASTIGLVASILGSGKRRDIGGVKVLVPSARVVRAAGRGAMAAAMWRWRPSCCHWSNPASAC